MRVMVTGSSGLIGNALVKTLTSPSKNHNVLRAVRSDSESISGTGDAATAHRDIIRWNPMDLENGLSARDLADVDAVVHLAGANLAGKRWTAAYKDVIRESRVRSTKLISKKLVEAIRASGSAGTRKTLVCASAIGIYGDRGDEILTEESTIGKGFLPEVCVEWEQAAQVAKEAGVRVCHARFGMVIDPNGNEGAMKPMVRVFKLGLGGKLGSGKQWWSWVSLGDAVRALEFLLMNESARGSYNVVSPNPVTNAEFTKALGKSLHRPTVVPAPAFALKLAMGEMAEAAILSSARVKPMRLMDAGFAFEEARIEEAIGQRVTE
ncbi:MAG TPA: TIGR01777 family oxidoreductase [Phycisphaerales bacterium]|nr:TIGR01777 family oxidoreductase [Phycisphaerales bacterium]